MELKPASFDEKRKIAGNYLAPFLYNEAELDEVVEEMGKNE